MLNISIVQTELGWIATLENFSFTTKFLGPHKLSSPAVETPESALAWLMPQIREKKLGV